MSPWVLEANFGLLDVKHTSHLPDSPLYLVFGRTNPVLSPGYKHVRIPKARVSTSPLPMIDFCAFNVPNFGLGI